ncbi:LADA_0D12574g1_1 [Lachancea dasiensis]|uniref:LADA_0D12574g1_1 n=1 Tax=Lachancea dasiensis TaxID=1072105 RepID=A0A1G4J8S0_9SACH|nr:LADA_0D12574g1_1 [Lachancea dasiensis]
MVFKPFKCKFYSKGYHSSAQKQTTAFFESSYQYLRRNQGLVSQESCIPSSHNVTVGLNPVVGANVNYNNVELALEKEKTEESQTPAHGRHDGSLLPREYKRGRESRRASLGATPSSSTAPRAHSLSRFRSHNSNDSYTHYPHNRQMEINERLSRSYFSSSAIDSTSQRSQDVVPGVTSAATDINAGQKSIETLDTGIQDQLTHDAPGVLPVHDVAFDSRTDPRVSPWEPDTEESLNPQTFLDTQTKQIKKAFDCGDYNSINAHYQALQRNSIIPTVEIYEIVIESVSRRDLDNDNVDNRMFQLLNCYQDLINNKMKPSEQIYNAVIGTLLKGSILAHDLGNTNGGDFYKIAIDLLKASNTNKTSDFSKEVLDCSLLAMNLYPGYVTLDYIQNFLHKSKLYFKDSFYYVALLSYAKFTNNSAAVKNLYEEFRNACVADTNLQRHRFEVYASVLSALVETGNTALAIKLLGTVLSEAKDKVGLASNVSLILSCFLTSVSKMDSQRAYDLWYEFKSLPWIPEFSYDFYLSMLSNSLGNWPLAKKIYAYMLPMMRESRTDKPTLSEQLLFATDTKLTLSSFLDYALQLKDTEAIMNLLEESMVKEFVFEPGVYPYVFQFLKSIRCPDDYLIRFIDCHGRLLVKGQDKFEFLNGLIDSYQSQVILSKVAATTFFVNCCKAFDISESRLVNYSGLIACFQSLWSSPQTIEKYSKNIELHALVICRLHDLEGYYSTMENEFLAQFRDNLNTRFEKLMINYKRLSLDPNMISGTAVQAAKVIGLSEDIVDHFAHPGDWDKSYPLCLGPMLRNSFSTGFKTYDRLRKEDYCFDYDTYKQLVTMRVNDTETVTKGLELCPDDQEIKFFSNCLVVKTFGKDLNDKVLKHPLFSKILPHLKDASILRLAKNTSDICFLIERIDFPKRFKGIAEQAEFKASIAYIYHELYRNKLYSEIVALNSSCPVLDVAILLKACVRSGNFLQYKTLFQQFKKGLASDATAIHAEYLINNLKVEEAIKLLRTSSRTTGHKDNDLLSFAVFLRSFEKRMIQLDEVENTLQLANVLSTQETFSSMVALYQTLTEEMTQKLEPDVKRAVNIEIADQLLNNLHASLQFVDFAGLQASSSMLQKLTNYFRFKSFLKLPEMNEEDVHKLLDIYEKVKPSAIDTLFNNVVETIYLNSNTRVIYLQNDLKFSFQPKQLLRLIESIGKFYHHEINEESAAKAQKFEATLKKLYKLEGATM